MCWNCECKSAMRKINRLKRRDKFKFVFLQTNLSPKGLWAIKKHLNHKKGCLQGASQISPPVDTQTHSILSQPCTKSTFLYAACCKLKYGPLAAESVWTKKAPYAATCRTSDRQETLSLASRSIKSGCARRQSSGAIAGRRRRRFGRVSASLAQLRVRKTYGETGVGWGWPQQPGVHLQWRHRETYLWGISVG